MYIHTYIVVLVAVARHGRTCAIRPVLVIDLALAGDWPRSRWGSKLFSILEWRAFTGGSPSGGSCLCDVTVRPYGMSRLGAWKKGKM